MTQSLDVMQIWPAIDIRGGKCVRLQQGDYHRETVFSDDPVTMAKRWVDEGAQRLHLVDLDGAREGRAINRDVIAAIRAAVNVPCQLGGGIRNERAMAQWFDIGLDRLVIGTRALKEPAWFRDVCPKYPSQVALAIDARNGRVATDGWLETSDLAATELARMFADLPLAAIVYTDIDKDGMLAGPNLDAMAEMNMAVEHPLIASGGVTSTGDIHEVARRNLAGCIIGRALYEGTLRLADAIAAAEQMGS